MKMLVPRQQLVHHHIESHRNWPLLVATAGSPTRSHTIGPVVSASPSTRNRNRPPTRTGPDASARSTRPEPTLRQPRNPPILPPPLHRILRFDGGQDLLQQLPHERLERIVLQRPLGVVALGITTIIGTSRRSA